MGSFTTSKTLQQQLLLPITQARYEAFPAGVPPSPCFQWVSGFPLPQNKITVHYHGALSLRDLGFAVFYLDS